MLAKATLAILAATVIATPAVARFEDEAEFGHDLSDYFVSQTSHSDGAACGQMIDVLDGYKLFLSADTSAEDEKSLLTILTGVAPEHHFQAPLPVVACN